MNMHIVKLCLLLNVGSYDLSRMLCCNELTHEEIILFASNPVTTLKTTYELIDLIVELLVGSLKEYFTSSLCFVLVKSRLKLNHYECSSIFMDSMKEKLCKQVNYHERLKTAIVYQ